MDQILWKNECTQMSLAAPTRRRVFRLWAAVWLFIAGSALPTAASADEVDIAVDSFAAAGTALGVSPGPEATQLVKAIVRCAIKNTPVLVCAREEVIKHLPAQAQELAKCVAQEENLGHCVSHAAANSAEKNALELVDKLGADGRSELGQSNPGQVRNIIRVAEGIRKDDWVEVSTAGGAEVYKLAAKAVLQIVISPPLAALIAPAVDAVVQSRIDLVVGLIEAIKKPDDPKIAALVVEFYLVAHVEIVCSLLSGMPAGEIRDSITEALCGTIGDAIKEIGGATSDVVQRAENAARGVLTAVGINPTGLFGPGCGTTASFYANRYAVCLKQSAFLEIAAPVNGEQFRDTLNSACRATFEPCAKQLFSSGTSERISQHCEPLRDEFEKQTVALATGLRTAAQSFMRAHVVEVLKASPGGVCGAGEDRPLIAKCAAALAALSSGLRSNNWSRCDSSVPLQDPFAGACRKEACRVITPRVTECLRYADNVLSVLKDAEEAHCDPKMIIGPRWDRDKYNHVQFCVGASPERVKHEIEQRQYDYQTCKTDALIPHGMSTLTVRQVESSGAFVLDGSGFEKNARVVIEISGPAARAQTITNKIADQDGKLTLTLSHAEVCALTGPVTIAAREGDRKQPSAFTTSCTPCTSAECLAPAAEFSVTDPRGQTSFLVKGTGFGPNVSVTITFSSSASRLPQPTQVTDASGSFALTLPTKDFCVKPGWLSVGVTEQGKPPLQAHRVNCDNPEAASPPSTVSNPTACASAPNACADGYVWRKTTDDDFVCVTEAARWLAQRENSVAGAQQRDAAPMRQRLSGMHSWVCNTGRVRRNATSGDTVCVTPAEAARVKAENEQARQHLACPM
ncbi:MAG: hypothetical protein WCE79_25020 [Xanthobacteraceae bacterium]